MTKEQLLDKIFDTIKEEDKKKEAEQFVKLCENIGYNYEETYRLWNMEQVIMHGESLEAIKDEIEDIETFQMYSLITLFRKAIVEGMDPRAALESTKAMKILIDKEKSLTE